MRREPHTTLTLKLWLETVGPKCVAEWISKTAADLAVSDIANWRYWAEMSDVFGDVARCLPMPETIEPGSSAPSMRIIRGGRFDA